jgi:hypothetical protein
MNADPNSLDHQLLSLLQAVRDTQDASARTALNELLRTDTSARAAMARLMVDEQALMTRLRDDSIVSLLESKPSGVQPGMTRTQRWYAWRPLTAAAAGIVFGMLCTSVVFGYVAQRMGVQKTPLSVFNSSFEEDKHMLEDGLPGQIGQWGVDAAQIVAAEASVTPFKGEHMMRLEAIPREKLVKNHTSRVYQLIDLRSLPSIQGETEVEVAASFCGTQSNVSSRYLIRAIVLDEPPELVAKNFWPKAESDGAVSESQRFDTVPGDSGWHTYSMKLRLPPGSQTLSLIFGAVPPEDASKPVLVHYLDDVQVSLLTPQPLP